MLNTLFLQVLNMSFTASIIIALVLLLRLLLKKVPKIFSYALWGVVLFRLVCPFSFESAISLLPTNPNPIPTDIIYEQVPQINTGIPFINNSINPRLPAPTQDDSMNPMQGWVFIGSVLWLFGIAVLLIYSVVSLLWLKKRLKQAVHERDNIYTSAHLSSPFVMGVFRPKIYLPANLSACEKQYILLHEQTHIARLDHVVKMLSFFVLCLHWFNPLAWAAFFLSGRDMEMSCDESVIRTLGSDVKKGYSTSLLTLATGRKIIGGTPLAFGEGDTKSRIKNVLNYKKPAFWVIVVCAAAVAAIGIGLIANPKATTIRPQTKEIPLYSVENLWSARTKYVGDNAAVGTLLGLLPLPQGLQHNHFGLLTSGEERGIEWVLDKSADATYLASEMTQSALLLFALVDNLEDFYVSVKDPSSGSQQAHYYRAWADKIVGGDVRDYAESEETLQTLLGFSATAPNITIIPGEYTITKLGKTDEPLPSYSFKSQKLAHDIVMDALVKSAEWEGLDVATLEECYLIRKTFANPTEVLDYYAYLIADDTAVLQSGTVGRYSSLSGELYSQLTALFE